MLFIRAETNKNTADKLTWLKLNAFTGENLYCNKIFVETVLKSIKVKSQSYTNTTLVNKQLGRKEVYKKIYLGYYL